MATEVVIPRAQDLEAMGFRRKHVSEEEQRGALESLVPGITFRWIHPENAHTWMNRGLAPVKRGQHILKNEGAFDCLADGTIRRGKLLLFGEFVENKQGRIKDQEREVQRYEDELSGRAQELVNEIKHVNAETGGEPVVALEENYGEGTEITQIEMGHIDDAEPKKVGSRRPRAVKQQVQDDSVWGGENGAEASEESKVLTGE